MGQAALNAVAADANCLVFRAGPLLCALGLDDVIEILRPLPARPLAGTPAFVLGVTILRGRPTPVIDIARLLGAGEAAASRFVAVRTERGPVAFATGEVLGLRPAVADAGSRHPALPGPAAGALVAGYGRLGAEPLLVLRSMRVVPDTVWAAAAAPNAVPA